MLMRPHDGRVDHRVFIVGIVCQGLEDPLPNAALGPAAEARVHRLPGAEPFRQVAPGYAGAIAVEHRFDEQPIVLGGRADVPLTPGQKILYPFPLVVAKSVAAHRSAPNQADLP
jgi:hypothetical protein